MAIPGTMKALVTLGPKISAVQEVPVPSISDDEILVKVVAVAQNPTDWQRTHFDILLLYLRNLNHLSFLYHDVDIDLVGNAGTICGCDFSGNVAAVGNNVTHFNVGDHVAGFTHGGFYKDRGAFAEYTKVSADLVWKVPENTLSHEEAATFGCA